MAELKKQVKKEATNTFNPKEINRRQLQKQNLIFVVSAVIIILVLVGAVGMFINFVIKQINYTFEKGSDVKTNLEGFDLKGFNEIKEKLPEPSEGWEKLLEGVTTTPAGEAEVSPVLTPATQTIENLSTSTSGFEESTSTEENNATSSEVIPHQNSTSSPSFPTPTISSPSPSLQSTPSPSTTTIP